MTIKISEAEYIDLEEKYSLADDTISPVERYDDTIYDYDFENDKIHGAEDESYDYFYENSANILCTGSNGFSYAVLFGWDRKKQGYSPLNWQKVVRK